MTLAALRKLAIKRQYQIHFRLRNGMECVVNEHGVAQVPQLQAPPDFNLEQELEEAAEFLIEPAVSSNPKAPARVAERPRRVTRQELAAMVSSPSAAAHAEHDEE